ncbi:alpha/beta fold hydrolase [Tenacibaculum aquimarinum]|uniref:alpha/beta fold hydrolase n=1 Tax=Tenacibaculum aquimarinum TaxID=2910675 RepID=UPI00286832E5|nr:hypothetical protein [Tenacibaculum aquimarinum]
MILQHKGINIFYSDVGKGSAVVLLHGFLENTTMWKDIVPKLTKRNRVITIDFTWSWTNRLFGLCTCYGSNGRSC